MASQELINKVTIDQKEVALNAALLDFFNASKEHNIANFLATGKNLIPHIKGYTKDELENVSIGQAIIESFGTEREYMGMRVCRPFLSPTLMSDDKAREFLFKIYGKTFYGMDDNHDLNSYLFYSLITFCAKNPDAELAKKVLKEYLLHKQLKVRHDIYSMVFFRSLAGATVLTNSEKNKIIDFVCLDMNPREKYFALGREAASFTPFLKFSKSAYIKLLKWSGAFDSIIASKTKTAKNDFAKENIIKMAFNVELSLIFSIRKIDMFFKIMESNGVKYTPKGQIAVIQSVIKSIKKDNKTSYKESLSIHLGEQIALLEDYCIAIMKKRLDKVVPRKAASLDAPVLAKNKNKI